MGGKKNDFLGNTHIAVVVALQDQPVCGQSDSRIGELRSSLVEIALHGDTRLVQHFDLIFQKLGSACPCELHNVQVWIEGIREKWRCHHKFVFVCY